MRITDTFAFYRRYLSSYISDMAHLGDEQPEALEYLKSGGFAVQIGEGI